MRFKRNSNCLLECFLLSSCYCDIFSIVVLKKTIKIDGLQCVGPTEMFAEMEEPHINDDSSASGGSSFEVWVRLTPAVEYIKLVVCKNRVVGALLIGDTELEEV